MTTAGDWPRDMKTTSVAPARPASVKSCQGWSDSASVEVSELIVQARVHGGIDARVAGERVRGRTRPAAGGEKNRHERDDR